MRIGCLQFAPQVGDVDNNLNRADAVLNRVDLADLESLDLLVLPEMAFSGYNFKTLEEITPFVEPSGSGISSLWARTTALKFDCIVAVGYPERARKEPFGEDYYNSLVVVNGDGETVANYRKSSLYYTDETWAKEGAGFYQGEIEHLGKVAMGICMDINPYKFQTPWSAFEFGFHILTVQANLVIISMAWLTLADAATFTSQPDEPDMETLTYWVQRMEPIIRAEGEGEIIFVFANRCGIEGNAVYAGTSAVLGVQNGEVSVYGLLGRGTKELLVVNTDMPPFAKLVSRPDGRRDADEDLRVTDGTEPAATVQEAARTSSNSSPAQSLPALQEGHNIGDRKAQGYNEHMDNEYSETSHYASKKERASPSRPGASTTTVSPRKGYKEQVTDSRNESREYRRRASPRDGFSPKEATVFQRAASTREGYSPRYPSPREEYAPRLASSGDGYFPSSKWRRDDGPPDSGSPRIANTSGTQSRRDHKPSRIPSPREWYGVTDTPAGDLKAKRSYGHPSGQFQDQDLNHDGSVDLASPVFPEPTPLSMRPKLAVSTGPETLPPLPKRAPPRGVQPGNFFSSRDLCTPPETPLHDESQPFSQKHWVLPSRFMYTPEEAEWPDAISGGEDVGQLPARRASPTAAQPTRGECSRPLPVRSVPARPASRTQEVKLSDLRRDPCQEEDVVSRHPFNLGTSSHAVISDRQQPAVHSERSATRKLKITHSQPVISTEITHSSNGACRPAREPPSTEQERSLPAAVQNLRAETSLPWNSITIVASPSVFKTEFQRSETFPRDRDHPTKKMSHSGTKEKTMRRSKSISAFDYHDPRNYLPSPALPVHKAYQDMIYSAVEAPRDLEGMWAAAGRTQQLAKEDGRKLKVKLGRGVRPEILSPMTV